MKLKLVLFYQQTLGQARGPLANLLNSPFRIIQVFRDTIDEYTPHDHAIGRPGHFSDMICT
jgi:hypothetical protein